MNSLIIDEFKRLCREAGEGCERSVSTSHFEPLLLRTLNFIKAHPEQLTEIKQIFVVMIARPNTGPWELITYCMRELQWTEVFIAAREELLKSNDFRVKDILTKIVEVYSVAWQDADLYSYYAKPRHTHS